MLRVWVAVFCLVVSATAEEGLNQELQDELRLLGKQVKTLLDRRREDLQSIEDNLRVQLYESPAMVKVQQEMEKLRRDMEVLRSNDLLPPAPSTHNEKLTLKWLSNSVSEIKMELVEVQTALNATVILQNREQMDAELSLLRSNVANLNIELDSTKRRQVKAEAELLEARDELTSLRDSVRSTSIMCGKTKNQLKVSQLEWSHNWKVLNQRKSEEFDKQDLIEHPSRHQRILHKHVINLEKNSKSLKKENERLKTRMLKFEEELGLLQDFVKSQVRTTTTPVPVEPNDVYDRINGNEIQDYVRLEKIRELENPITINEALSNLTRQQSLNEEKLNNLTQQLSNFDRLHMSMLELLENVESIENKVDTSIPEFRKEISKLESQVTDSSSVVAMLREDQTNTRSSVKAIGVSVSNMQDKTDGDHKLLLELDDTVQTVIKSSDLQQSKLHDHILKAEAATIDLNSTKSAIHLVQELKSFEKEYKNIVNKLPRDCSLVSGPNGIYLISPGDGEPILAQCNDGWTTIQKRYDGSVDFNRNWNEYSNGFGSATGEHWLGNRNLHYLSRDNCTMLQINMQDIYGKYWQANYSDFRVADFAMGFKLVISGYQGNASDALDYQNKMEFSTVDNDRDISNTHCASNYEGGWWFSHCQHANLNGRYNLGLTWFDSSRNEWIAVSYSDMRVKRRQVC